MKDWSLDSQANTAGQASCGARRLPRLMKLPGRGSPSLTPLPLADIFLGGGFPLDFFTEFYMRRGEMHG